MLTVGWLTISLVMARAAGYGMGRFGVGWWITELFQLGVILVAFLLIFQRIQRLEVEVRTLKARLEAIAASVRHFLRWGDVKEDVLDSAA